MSDTTTLRTLQILFCPVYCCFYLLPWLWCLYFTFLRSYIICGSNKSCSVLLVLLLLLWLQHVLYPPKRGKTHTTCVRRCLLENLLPQVVAFVCHRGFPLSFEIQADTYEIFCAFQPNMQQEQQQHIYVEDFSYSEITFSICIQHSAASSTSLF